MKLFVATILSSIALSTTAFLAVTTTAITTIQLNSVSEDHQVQHVDTETPLLTRRESLAKSLWAGVMAAGILSSSDAANAFPNKISNKYDDRPKQRGSKPKNLGIGKRKDMAGEEYIGLKECGAAPNCFCSTDTIENSPESNIPPFKWDSRVLSSRKDAFQQLYEVVKAYEPGQSNIDGGGFDIITFDPEAGYIYVQFESLKNGYVDDLELALINKEDNVVQVRSSSRLGYLDFGVNAKRINYLAKALREKGWDAPGVIFATHKGYAEENGVTSF
jgi:uncharacterized protein (DUF1499 family)